MTRRIHPAQMTSGGITMAALLGTLTLAGGITDADAQGSKGQALEVFEAAQQAPPEHAELERATREAPAAPAQARPGVDELVGQIARQRGGKERLEQARKGGRPEHAFAASQRPPPDAAELERQKPPAPPRSMRPTRQELEQAISRQEGGRGKLDRARQGGRPDQPPPRTSATQRVAEWFAWLPEVIASAHAAGELSVTLTPKVNTSGAHAELYGKATAGTDVLSVSAYMRSVQTSSGSPSNSHVTGYPYLMNWDADTRSRGERPFLGLTVRVPLDGYYIINARAHGPAGVQLRRYQSATYPVVQTYDASGTADRPALVYLTRGYHYFYWVSPSHLIFYSASVDSYP